MLDFCALEEVCALMSAFLVCYCMYGDDTVVRSSDEGDELLPPVVVVAGRVDECRQVE